MLSFLAFALSAYHSDAISIECPALTIKDALAALSKEAGVSLTAGPSLADERLVLVAEKASLAELKARIAAVTCGRWDEGVLKFDAKVAKKRQEDALRAYALKIGEAQKRLLKPVLDHPTFDTAQAARLLEEIKRLDSLPKQDDNFDTYEKTEAAMSNSPGHRFAARVIALIDPYEIAAAPANAVYSDRPNRLQRPLGTLDATYRSLAQEQTAWTTVFPPEPGRLLSGSVNDPRRYSSSIVSGGLRCVVKVTNTNPGQPTAMVYVIDQTGQSVISGWVNLETRFTPTTPSATAPAKSGKLSISKETEAFANALGLGPHVPNRVGEPWRKVLLDPVKHEPLTLGLAPLVIAAAKACHENLVALVPDEAIRGIGLAWDDKREPVTSTRFLQLLPHAGMEAIKEGDWRMLWPDSPRPPVDRHRLAALLTTLDTTGMLRLDDLGGYAAASPGDYVDDLTYTYCQAIMPGSFLYLSESPWPLVAMFGLLDGGQRATLRQGKPVVLHEVPPAAMAAVENYILRASFANLTHFDDRGRKVQSPNALGSEPTEVLGGGYDKDGVVGMVIDSGPGLAAIPAAQTGRITNLAALGLGELAAHLLTPDLPQLKDYTELHGAAATLGFAGTDTEITLQFWFSRHILWTAHLADHAFDLRQTPVAISAFAKDHLSEIAAEQKRLRQIYKPDPSNRSTPPPSARPGF